MNIQTAMVTGADHGLGLALVEELLDKGAVVFAGQFLPEGVGLALLAERYGTRLKIVPLDIGSTESVKAAAAAVASQTDRLDLLLNNAGVLGDVEQTIFDELNYEEMLQVYNVNTLGPLRMIQNLLPLIVNGTGKLIVNISSEAGSIGQNWRNNWFAYTMSKAALNMQSSVVFNALKESDVNLLLFHPGWMKTFMRGTLDVQAEMTAQESAAKLMALILERADAGRGDRKEPEYMDYNGMSLPW